MCKHRLHIWLFADPLDSFGLCGSARLTSAFAGVVSGCSGCLLPRPAAGQCLTLLFGIPNTISGWHCPPGHRGCLLRSAPAGTGALMQRVCTWHLYLNSAIHRLSKILQWEEQQWLRLLRLVLICRTVLFPCLRLSACSHSGWGQLGCSVCPGDQQLLPEPGEPAAPACS